MDDHNTNLPWKSNVSKTLRVNNTIICAFLNEHPIIFLMAYRLIEFHPYGSVVNCLKFMEILKSQNLRLSIKNLTLSLPVTSRGHNIDLPWNSNIWEMVRVNDTITKTFWKKKKKLSNKLLNRSINYYFAVLHLMFKLRENFAISKIDIFCFSVTGRVKKSRQINKLNK